MSRHIWAFADETGTVEYAWGQDEAEALRVFGRPAVAAVKTTWERAPFPCGHARIADGRVVEMTAAEQECVDAPGRARAMRRELEQIAGQKLAAIALDEDTSDLDHQIASTVQEIRRLEALAHKRGEP